MAGIKKTIGEWETPAGVRAFPLLFVMQLIQIQMSWRKQKMAGRENQLSIPPRVPLPAHMRNTVISSFVSEPRVRFMAKETARRIRK